ncbi:MAG: hypothetical protein R3E64_13460 [Halioglobus sp.]
MKLVSGILLLAISVGSGHSSIAAPLKDSTACSDSSAVCDSGDSGSAYFNAVEGDALSDGTSPSINSAATTGENTDAPAPAPTVATLGLFGLALLILGFFRRKRIVHRQLP